MCHWALFRNGTQCKWTTQSPNHHGIEKKITFRSFANSILNIQFHPKHTHSVTIHAPNSIVSRSIYFSTISELKKNICCCCSIGMQSATETGKKNSICKRNERNRYIDITFITHTHKHSSPLPAPGDSHHQRIRIFVCNEHRIAFGTAHGNNDKTISNSKPIFLPITNTFAPSTFTRWNRI